MVKLGYSGRQPSTPNDEQNCSHPSRKDHESQREIDLIVLEFLKVINTISSLKLSLQIKMDGEGEGGEIDVVENSSVPNASSATETTIDSFARKLRVKYPQLMIHNSVAPKDGTKFLHIWKLSKQVRQKKVF